jgi:hypothetical protein
MEAHSCWFIVENPTQQRYAFQLHLNDIIQNQDMDNQVMAYM